MPRKLTDDEMAEQRKKENARVARSYHLRTSSGAAATTSGNKPPPNTPGADINTRKSGLKPLQPGEAAEVIVITRKEK